MFSKIFKIHPVILGAVAAVFWVLLAFVLQPTYANQPTSADLYELTNETRSEVGLTELTVSPALELAAQQKAHDMISKGYWDHTNPDGTTPWDFILQSNYSYITAGENLARGYADSEQTHQAWLLSPTHYANIIGEYQEVGIAIVNGELDGRQTTIVVALYATPTIAVRAQ